MNLNSNNIGKHWVKPAPRNGIKSLTAADPPRLCENLWDVKPILQVSILTPTYSIVILCYMMSNDLNINRCQYIAMWYAGIPIFMVVINTVYVYIYIKFISIHGVYQGCYVWQVIARAGKEVTDRIKRPGEIADGHQLH